MLTYKTINQIAVPTLILLYVIIIHICCVYGDAIQANIAILCQLVSLYSNLAFYVSTIFFTLNVIYPSNNTSMKMVTIGGRNM
jgi:hypothetical protein